MPDIINHEELAISRLATQFRESTNLINYIKALLSEADTLEAVFQSLLNDRWIDTAVGIQLDILGSIVGQSRIIIDASNVFYFGFLGDPTSVGFGNLDDPTEGGRLRSIDEITTGNRALTDDEYRLFIKARAIKNSIIPTIQNTINFFKFLFEVEEVTAVDGNMSYSIQIGRILTLNEKTFLLNTDLVPKVAAVGVTYFEYETNNAFGFSEDPTSLGFGDLNDSNVGGSFASIIG